MNNMNAIEHWFEHLNLRCYIYIISRTVHISKNRFISLTDWDVSAKHFIEFWDSKNSGESLSSFNVIDNHHHDITITSVS